ncbi:MAG: succinylglutamate desuccinylase/aspartoacylase family protein [Halobacteriales archaeon]|nr:succinylglutamate desuccinylase/aspartoacylase family protein [Halobacteriales archaeon]
MLEFGTAQAEPGERDTGVLSAGETRDGSGFSLPVAVINGAGDGDTLYIQAVSDGDELNGVGVVREVVRRLEPTQISGNILFVGILNYHGFQVAEHRNPIDRNKLNRTFPGDPDGSSSERLAHLVYDNGVKHADIGLDLHQGSTSRMIDEVRVRCGRGHRLHDECLELARAFGTEYILDQKGPEGQLARSAPDDGIPVVDPELGGAVGWDDKSINKGVQGVMNVLSHYGFVEGEHSTPSEQFRAKSFDVVHANRGGLLDLSVDLYDRVEKGDGLFDVTGVFGEKKETVEATKDGIVWRTRRLPMVATGEYVMSVATGVERL